MDYLLFAIAAGGYIYAMINVVRWIKEKVNG